MADLEGDDVKIEEEQTQLGDTEEEVCQTLLDEEGVARDMPKMTFEDVYYL